MAGTVTITHEERGAIEVVSIAWTADAADASVPDTAIPEIAGRLFALETDPGATAPTNLYDITLVDQNGHDVLEGVGGDRSATATEKAAVVFSGTAIHPPVHYSDTLTFNLDNNSVNSATGVAKLYVSKA